MIVSLIDILGGSYMKFNFKKQLVGLFSVGVVLASATVGTVYATTAYHTTLTMTSNSTLEGAERYYDTGYYYISICPNSFQYEANNKGVDAYSAFKNWFAYYDEVGKTVSMSTTGITYLEYLGHANSGNRVYHFSTWSRPGFSSNAVTLSSGSAAS